MANAPRKLIIVYGNDRPDIQLIYDEVADQARRNGLDVLVYRPGLKKFERQTVAPPWGPVVSSEPLNPRHWARALSAIRNPNRFFTSGRLRAWTLLDYLAFQQVIAREKPEFVFCLEPGHARGAVFACDDAAIQLITHQHGDYYHAIGTKSCFEGESGVCLVWNKHAARYLSELRTNKDIVPAGSLKHIRLMRERLPAETLKSLVFLDTYDPDTGRDRQRARDQAAILRDLQSVTRLPCRIKYHPIRLIESTTRHHQEIREIYRSYGLEACEAIASSANVAITSESNAIYDMIARGIPCLCILEFNSVLSLGADFPGAVRGQGSELSQAICAGVQSIAAEPDKAVADQLSYIQKHVVGDQAQLDKHFSEILARRQQGTV